MRIDFTVNGRPRRADDVWEGESLLYVLRERLGLPGSKNACEQGEGGSCTVRTGIGSAAPTPLRATAAEDFLNAALEEGGFWGNGKIITPSVVKQFEDPCSAACNPIGDVRGTASYRRHAVGVMARRTLTWTWEAYRGAHRTTEGAA